jgi:membrane protein
VVEGGNIEVAVRVDHGGRGTISVVNVLRKWSIWWRTSDSRVATWLRSGNAALLGEMPVLAAGTALFAIIAVVPLLAAAVAIYGLVANPARIQSEIGSLAQVLPYEVVDFIGDQLQRQAARSTGELGLQLVVAIGIALFSARGSARALIDSLNRAYRVRELRSAKERFVITMAMALFTLLGLMSMFALLVVLPAIVAFINQRWIVLALYLRWPAMLAVLFFTLLLLYRYGPSPRPLGPRTTTEAGGAVHLPYRPVRHICIPGAGIATVLLLLVSWALSVWVHNIARTDVIYGAFGSVIVTILWFYLSTMTLMFGGFVNAELERQAGAPEPDRSMY